MTRPNHAGEQFARRLRELAPLPDQLRGQIFDLLRQAVGARISVQQLAARERADHAHRLLEQGAERTAVCLRLCARFNVSQRTAYRSIEQALRERTPNLCQEAPLSGKAGRQSEGLQDHLTEP